MGSVGSVEWPALRPLRAAWHARVLLGLVPIPHSPPLLGLVLIPHSMPFPHFSFLTSPLLIPPPPPLHVFCLRPVHMQPCVERVLGLALVPPPPHPSTWLSLLSRRASAHVPLHATPAPSLLPQERLDGVATALVPPISPTACFTRAAHDSPLHASLRLCCARGPAPSLIPTGAAGRRGCCPGRGLCRTGGAAPGHTAAGVLRGRGGEAPLVGPPPLAVLLRLVRLLLLQPARFPGAGWWAAGCSQPGSSSSSSSSSRQRGELPGSC